MRSRPAGASRDDDPGTPERAAGDQGVRSGATCSSRAFARATERLRDTSVRANFLTYLMERTPNIGVMVFNLLVVGIGATSPSVGSSPSARSSRFRLLLMNLSSAVYGLTWAIPYFVQGAAGMQRIDEILARARRVEDPTNAVAMPRLARSIRFDSVTFGYGDEPSHLESLNFELAAGGMIAFVGASGSGKSTALNLLLRFYDPRAGAVRFDGLDLRDVTQESLHARIGVVFQESLLFNTTVRENIRYGRSRRERRGRRDARHVWPRCTTRFAQFRDGYDTIVGERGAKSFGRAAPARRDRAGAPARPRTAPARRGDVGARSRRRGVDQRNGRPAPRRPNDHHRHASAWRPPATRTASSYLPAGASWNREGTQISSRQTARIASSGTSSRASR